MGFPAGFTQQCFRKAKQDSQEHEDCRLSLVGNSWHVGVIAWLLSELLIPLGVVEPLTLQELVFRMTPGCSSTLQGLLLRPPLSQGPRTFSPSDRLTAKLCGLISLKGEDIMLQSQTEVPIKYHRLRTSLPARLWRWKVVSGWKWKGDVEHINVLEARAAMTSIRWRVLQKKTNQHSLYSFG